MSHELVTGKRAAVSGRSNTCAPWKRNASWFRHGSAWGAGHRLEGGLNLHCMEAPAAQTSCRMHALTLPPHHQGHDHAAPPTKLSDL